MLFMRVKRGGCTGQWLGGLISMVCTNIDGTYRAPIHCRRRVDLTDTVDDPVKKKVKTPRWVFFYYAVAYVVIVGAVALM